METRVVSLGAVFALFAAGACFGGSGVETAPAGLDTRGTITVAGVGIEARFDDWDGRPKHLDQKLTPVLVRIDNNGDRPMVVRLDKLVLSDGTRRYAAMPPFDINRAMTIEYTVPRPHFPNWSFQVAPYLLRYYPGSTPVEGAFEFNGPYYAPRLLQLADQKLPSPDMVQLALPEGVLEPHGHVAGFVYFERVPPERRQRLELVALLLDSAGQRMATATIAFANGS